jgi:hypothetical protein
MSNTTIPLREGPARILAEKLLKVKLDIVAYMTEYEPVNNKRTTSFYLTEEALEALEEVGQRWGVGRNAVVEIAARLMKDNPSIFFRMVARNSIIIPDDEEEPQH